MRLIAKKQPLYEKSLYKTPINEKSIKHKFPRSLQSIVSKLYLLQRAIQISKTRINTIVTSQNSIKKRQFLQTLCVKDLDNMNLMLIVLSELSNYS